MSKKSKKVSDMEPRRDGLICLPLSWSVNNPLFDDAEMLRKLAPEGMRREALRVAFLIGCKIFREHLSAVDESLRHRAVMGSSANLERESYIQSVAGVMHDVLPAAVEYGGAASVDSGVMIHRGSISRYLHDPVSGQGQDSGAVQMPVHMSSRAPVSGADELVVVASVEHAENAPENAEAVSANASGNVTDDALMSLISDPESVMEAVASQGMRSESHFEHTGSAGTLLAGVAGKSADSGD